MSSRSLLHSRKGKGSIWTKYDNKIAEAEKKGKKSVRFEMRGDELKKAQERYEQRGYKTQSVSDLIGTYLIVTISSK